MTDSPFVMSVETDAGTYQYGFHLGTIESVARSMVEDRYLLLVPKIGTRVITIALMRDHKVFDVYDGSRWSSSYVPYEETDIETAYGSTVRLSRSIRIF